MYFHRHAARWRRHHHPSRGEGGPRGGHGRGFGIRRPLRFLIDRLELDEDQAAEVSKVLEDRRLEREQADLDRRRAQARLADLFEGDTLDPTALAEAAAARVSAAERERDASVTAVTRLHPVLSPVQRRKLATLVRGGPFTL